jgi:hypothetical protein
VGETSGSRQLLDAIVTLHRQKDAAYGIAWKKRGEVIGVMANIARKADRLENVAAGGPDTPDESNLDTAIDLFVYVVKYCAYLADQDDAIDARLFAEQSDGRGTRSDGTVFVEQLLHRYATSPATTPAVADASISAAATFDELMNCFGSDGFAAPQVRLALAERLAAEAWALVLAYATSTPDTASAFVGASG